ncbi:alpha/beta fold hydrolase [Vibrio viridaestus]|uniref:Alpha/beta hydrolase n=1 Tax=Vibrio viridaestus TaxID=2487322 RepID=A0A3N9U0N5_9VIBR|nr:alpha/beta hydrolase [Vibrio viridaestus]RQW62802.1 alpha/beta hydrolase [Vibrio viridaestus]
METQKIVINNNHFRFKLYPNTSTTEYAVFLLGALQDIESVDNFSNDFSKHVNCLTVEIPGTGLNAPLDSTVTIHEQSMMLLDLLEYLDIRKAHLIGFSYATAITVEVCSVWSGALSLSICGGVPGIPKSGRMATKQMIASAMVSTQNFAKTFTDSLTSNEPGIPRSKAIKRATERNIAHFDQERVDVFFENSVRLLVHKPCDLSKLTLPATVCVGEFDPYVTKDIAQDFARQLPNSRFLIIKDADHMVHLEFPDKVASLLIALAAASAQVSHLFDVMANEVL